jgi:hypothetical protein
MASVKAFLIGNPMRKNRDRHLRERRPAGRENPSVTGDDAAVAIHQYRVIKTEFPDAGGDWGDLLVGADRHCGCTVSVSLLTSVRWKFGLTVTHPYGSRLYGRLNRLQMPLPRIDPDPPRDVHKFVMSVPRSGYRWIDKYELLPSPRNAPGMQDFLDYEDADPQGKSPRQPCMIQADPHLPARLYEPLVETPDLFIKFRELNRDRESILQFANEYGWICHEGLLNVPDGWYRPRTAVGFQKWTTEIEDLITADRLASLARQEDNRTLGQYFSWHPKRFDVEMHFQVDGRELRRIVRPAHEPPAWMRGGGVMSGARDLEKEGWKRGDYIRVALAFVERYVNERIALLCHPLLQVSKRGRLTGYLTSQNLLGCIWLQFYLSQIGQLKLRRCVVCGGEMDVTQSRSSRAMHTRCSRNKRQAKWREGRKSPETK